MALDLAETLQYVHGRGVIWDDISTRNILLFDNFHIKLGDFAGSCLRDTYPDLLSGCKPRYWIPDIASEIVKRNEFETEMFAFGTCMCEITERAIPYGKIDDEKLQEKLMNGEYPHVSQDNSAKGVTQRLWNFEYNSAQEVFDHLSKLLNWMST